MIKQIEARADQIYDINLYENETLREINTNYESNFFEFEFKKSQIEELLDTIQLEPKSILNPKDIYHVVFQLPAEKKLFSLLLVVTKQGNTIFTESNQVKIEKLIDVVLFKVTREILGSSALVPIMRMAELKGKMELVCIHDITSFFCLTMDRIKLETRKVKTPTEVYFNSKVEKTLEIDIFDPAAETINILRWQSRRCVSQINLGFLFSLYSNINSTLAFEKIHLLREAIYSYFTFKTKKFMETVCKPAESKMFLDTYKQYMPQQYGIRAGFTGTRLITLADSNIVNLEKETRLSTNSLGIDTGLTDELIVQPINYIAQEDPIVLSLKKVDPTFFTKYTRDSKNYYGSINRNLFLLNLKVKAEISCSVTHYVEFPSVGVRADHYSTSDLVEKRNMLHTKQFLRKYFYATQSEVTRVVNIKYFDPESYNSLTNTVTKYIKEGTILFKLKKQPELRVFCNNVLRDLSNRDDGKDCFLALDITKKESTFQLVYRVDNIIVEYADLRAILLENTTGEEEVINSRMVINPLNSIFNNPENNNQKYIKDIMHSTIKAFISFLNNELVTEETVLMLVMKKTEGEVPFFFCIKSETAVFNLSSIYWLFKVKEEEEV